MKKIVKFASIIVFALVLSLALTALVACERKDAEAFVTDSEGMEYRLNDDGVTYSITGRGTSTNENLVVPDYVNGKPVTRIADYAFRYCGDIKTAELSSGLTEIGHYAFYHCEGISEITIPDSVVAVGLNAFGCCYGLEEVTVGKGLIYSLSLDGGTSTSWSAFANCENLTVVNWNATAAIGSVIFSSCKNLEKLNFGEGVKVIPSYIAEGCGKIKEITMPSTVRYIGNCAFSNTEITEITVPEGVTEIGYHAFASNDKLEKLTLPQSLRQVGGNIIYESNPKIYYQGDIGGYLRLEIDSVDKSFLQSSQGLYVDDKLVTQVVVPDGITAINDYAFYSYEPLTGVILGKDVESIGDYAFCECSNLQFFQLNDKLKTIGGHALNGCDNITSFICSATSGGMNIESIGEYAFYDCSALQHVSFGEKLSVIERYAFGSCEQLETVIFNDALEQIGEYAFYCCGVTAIDLPDSLTSLGERAFSNCSKLDALTLGKGLTKIGAATFTRSGLWLVVIPEGVTEIDADAFGGAPLQDVFLPSTIQKIGSYAFYGSNSEMQVHISATSGQWDRVDATYDWCNIGTVIVCTDQTVNWNPYERP